MSKITNIQIVRFIFAGLSCFTLGLFVLYLWNLVGFYEGADSDIAQKSLFLQVIREVKPKLEKVWKYGDIDELYQKGQIECPKDLGTNKNIDTNFLKCNSHFFHCYLEGKLNRPEDFKVKIGKKNYQVQANKIFKNKLYTDNRFVKNISQKVQGIQYPHPNGVLINLSVKEIPGFHASLFLKKDCHESLLPERVYAKKVAQDEWKWDNFGQNISFDTYPVSVQDVNDWIIEVRPELKSKVIIEKNKWGEYSTNLILAEQKEYCQYNSKQLMNSRVYAAATYLPNDLKNPTNLYIKLPPYPWSRNKKKSFLHLAKLGEVRNYLTKSNCKKSFTKECTDKYPELFFNTDSVSWSGFYSILGGFFESFDNKVNPDLNFKLSSKYFTMNSPYQQRGEIGRGSGESHGIKEFKWGRGRSRRKMNEVYANSEFKYGVQFRCMREIE
jgi:hypothetical protein